jgi:hypothetical protein
LRKSGLLTLGIIKPKNALQAEHVLCDRLHTLISVTCGQISFQYGFLVEAESSDRFGHTIRGAPMGANHFVTAPVVNQLHGPSQLANDLNI